MVGGQLHAPAAFSPGKGPGTHEPVGTAGCMRQTECTAGCKRQTEGTAGCMRQTESTVPAARCVSSVHGSDSVREQCPLGSTVLIYFASCVLWHCVLGSPSVTPVVTWGADRIVMWRWVVDTRARVKLCTVRGCGTWSCTDPIDHELWNFRRRLVEIWTKRVKLKHRIIVN